MRKSSLVGRVPVAPLRLKNDQVSASASAQRVPGGSRLSSGSNRSSVGSAPGIKLHQ